MKTLGLLSLIISALLLTACGGGGSKKSDPMKDKKYIIIYTNVAAGVCESNEFKSYLSGEGFENFLVRETSNTSTCGTYGRKNDNEECLEIYTGGGNTNCVIGFDSVNGEGNLKTFSLDVTESLENSF